MIRKLIPLLLVAALGAGCKDGGHFFSGKLEPQPIVPGVPQADTSPIEIFTTMATAPTSPALAYAGAPTGLALVRQDTIGTGQEANDATLIADHQGQLEDTDALVCDPGNNRLVLVKSRIRVNPAIARQFGPTLASPTAAFVTVDRHAIVATSAGYSVLDKTGGSADHALTGGPFQSLAFSDQGAVVFLASASQIQRLSVDGSFAPSAAGVAVIYDNSGSAAIRGLALKANGDLLFTEGSRLRRIAGASNAQAVDDLQTFSGSEEPRGVLVNSAGNAVVAVSTGAGGRLDEIVPGTGRLSSLTLTAAPVAVAIDGRHSAISWTSAGAGGFTTQIEPVPDLTKRLLPFFTDRSCVACHLHNSSFTITEMDLTTPQAARTTLRNVPSDCDGTLRVKPGDPAGSLLVNKLLGTRVDSSASCGDRMPLSPTPDPVTQFNNPQRPVPQIEIDIISRWIAAGANP